MTETKKDKLNAVIAVEKGVKSRTYGRMTEIYKTFQKQGFESLHEYFMSAWSNGLRRWPTKPEMEVRVLPWTLLRCRRFGRWKDLFT